MKPWLRPVLAVICLCGSTAFAADRGAPASVPPKDMRFRSVFTERENSKNASVSSYFEEEKARQSLFADGPQVALEALRKENLELKATISQLMKRVESLEHRLSQAERGNIRLLSDEGPLPDALPSLLQFPEEIERGMQADAFMHRPGAGAIIWNR